MDLPGEMCSVRAATVLRTSSVRLFTRRPIGSARAPLAQFQQPCVERERERGIVSLERASFVARREEKGGKRWKSKMPVL